MYVAKGAEDVGGGVDDFGGKAVEGVAERSLEFRYEASLIRSRGAYMRETPPSS